MTFVPDVAVVNTTSSATDPTSLPFVDAELVPPPFSTLRETWFVVPSMEGPAHTIEAVNRRAMNASRTGLV
jgi:hypothetical protein